MPADGVVWEGMGWGEWVWGNGGAGVGDLRQVPTKPKTRRREEKRRSQAHLSLCRLGLEEDKEAAGDLAAEKGGEFLQHRLLPHKALQHLLLKLRSKSLENLAHAPSVALGKRHGGLKRRAGGL